MSAQILATQLLAAFAALADPTSTVSGVTVAGRPPEAIAKNPDAKFKIDGDGSSANFTIYPTDADSIGIEGRVTLSCLIDVHGIAEWCKVAGEIPYGKRFGQAALAMRPILKITPASGPDGQPVAKVMTINLSFSAPIRDYDSTLLSVEGAGTSASANMTRPVVSHPRTLLPQTLLTNPVWIEAPSFAQVALAYPNSTAGGAEGYVALHCRVEPTGYLSRCDVISEDPQDKGFRKAALSLSARFRLSAEVARRNPYHDPLFVNVAIRFPKAAEAKARRVDAPIWLSGFDAKAAPKIFPPEATAAGVTSGHGVARCTVGRDGTMSACEPEAAEPAGLGFSEAAAKLAATLKMNLWSADGGPVEGGEVRVGIRLNLKDAGG